MYGIIGDDLLLKIFSVFRRSFFHHAFEIVIEICQVAVSALIAYPCYLLICLGQHLGSQADTDILDIVHECLICLSS